MIKHLEIKTYEYCGVNVTAKIDYDCKTISLVESEIHKGYAEKKWLFSNRGLEFVKGWENVLLAMNYAIGESSNELKNYLDMKEKEKHDEVTEVLLTATDMVKNRSYKCGKCDGGRFPFHATKCPLRNK